MLGDLKRSGLGEHEAAEMKLTPLSEQQVYDLFKIRATAYKIPYFDIVGKPTSFFRIRLLSAPKGRFAADQQKKPLRYLQPKNTEPQLYFAPFVDWKEVAADPSYELSITEGEKKAAAACCNDITTIGLGGVWNFRTSRGGLLPAFEEIIWVKRRVNIIFDSDLVTNDNVGKAAMALSEELTRLGALVNIVYLPPNEDGSKQGLDDYLLHNAASNIDNELSMPYDLGRELMRLNDEVAILKTPRAIYEFETGMLLTKNDAVGLAYADRIIQMRVNEKLKKVNVMSEWIEWPQRRTHEKLVYEPGKPAIHNNCINTWKGWGCEPKKGDIKPWKEFMNYMFASEKSLLPWFEQWLAYPLQNPGGKMFSAVLIHGLTHGTGKSFIGVIMSRIYGENFGIVTQEDLDNEFTEWAVNKQFVMGEEITGSDRRRDTDRLKFIISRESLTINRKYMPVYTVRDCINYYFTSQHPDAIFIEKTDRRFMVHEAPSEPMSPEFYARLDAWKNSSEGPSALFHYLLNLDLSGFNPLGHAPQSVAKAEMREISGSDLDMFVHSIRIDPDSTLQWGGVPLDADLFTVSEILSIYEQENPNRKTTMIAMSKALRRGGFKALPLVRTRTGVKKLWALRNVDHWRKASSAARAAHYDSPGMRRPPARRGG